MPLNKSPARRPRVAFVAPRCGLEVNGGAEAHCLQVAQRMAEHWNTEVLTTCALDYMRWDNFYPEGCEEIGAAVVRRFAVDEPRDVERFNALSAALDGRQGIAPLAEQEAWMRAQGPMSTKLLEFISAQADEYDAFIFFTYLYATSYFGLPLVREKAYLAPLAQDEWPIYFSMWERFFALPKGFLFNTEWEQGFLRSRFPALTFEGRASGVGIEPPPLVEASAFRRKYRLEEPFLLYLGRIDESKGCGLMFDYFLRERKDSDVARKLVLAGKEVMPIPFHEDIIHLGFVGEAEKWEAVAACDWLWMPSIHESLSMVLLEAWSVGRPAIVNADCGVLMAHCQKGHGGLWYSNYEEWNAILTQIDPATKDILGKQGREYVRTNYSWERVEADYLATLQL